MLRNITEVMMIIRSSITLEKIAWFREGECVPTFRPLIWLVRS